LDIASRILKLTASIYYTEAMDDTARGEESDAIAEGRRIYLGNLLYSVKPHDIEAMLEETGFQYDKIHISIDPVSGRNSGYCFIEFPHRDEAERALSSLGGTIISGRPVKVGPCYPKAAPRGREGRRDPQDPPAFQRWGDWRSDRQNPVDVEQGPHGALQHLAEMAAHDQNGRRLYVGGLGKMIDQEQNYTEVRELFTGFDVTAIGKRITPHQSTRSKPGNHHYCFVDLGSADEARAAIRALNGTRIPGGTLRVSLARGIPPKSMNSDGDSRGTVFDETGQQLPESNLRDDKQRGIASGNWRTRNSDQTQ